MSGTVKVSTCIYFAIGWAIGSFVFDLGREVVSQEPAAWNAFAAAGEDPLPVEGKKPKPDKHKHDETIPTPAPAPEPDAKPVPIPKRPDSKPHVVKPNKPSKPEETEGGHHNGDKTIDKTITNIVYRSSWTPSPWDLMALTLAALSLLISIVTARRSGLALSTFLTFWK